MENMIENFVRVEAKQKYSSEGDGSGFVRGYGDGGGYGFGSGNSHSSGNSNGYGDGSGDGFGFGYSDGGGDGFGFGSSNNKYIKTFNKENVYSIDNIATIIKSVNANIAQGFILKDDFTLSPCFIIREGNTFAHGYTLHEAYEALQNKLFSIEPKKRESRN